jgi:hypothetical protein
MGGSFLSCAWSYSGNKSDERERGQNSKPCHFRVVVELRGVVRGFHFDSP